ncbi:MAG: POTRA domain-containing protein [Thermonemataceae bacterium]|nr:POTRA domain-containing protein [Thermonemataceae bacterium]
MCKIFKSYALFFRYFFLINICFSGFYAAFSQNTHPYFILDSLKIEGNKKTKIWIIEREVHLKKGDTIWQKQEKEQTEQIKNRLFNLNLFLNVEVGFEARDSLHKNLKISIKERFYLFAAPIFELADRNFNEWWYDRNKDLSRTNYGLILIKKNLRGRNETLEFNFQAGFLGKLKVAYKIPYIDKKQRYGLQLAFAYNQYKNLAYETEENKLVFLKYEHILKDRYLAEIRLSRRDDFYQFHHLDMRFTKSSINDTILQLNPYYHLDSQAIQKYFFLSYQYNYDSRDFASYPLKGQKILVGVEKMGILPTDNLNLWLVKLAWQRYYALSSKKWYVDASLGARFLWHSGQPYSNASALGYGNDLPRAYQLYVVDGQHYGILKSTLKYELFKTQKHFSFIPIKQFATIPLAVYPNLHYDMAYASDNIFIRQKPNPLANQFLWGVGIGLDFITYYNTVFQVDITYNKHREWGFFLNFDSSF